MATIGRIKIIGERRGSHLLTGNDIRVVIEVVDLNEPGGIREVLVPALSLSLRVGSRHEQAVATIEVPAVLVNLDGVELRTEAVVSPHGPESQWEESLGKVPGERVADADQYSTNPHVVAGEPMRPIETAEVVVRDPVYFPPTKDPMAELDAVIMAGGKIEP